MSDKLRVWAPLLEAIQIEVATGEGSSRSPMEPADGGWWEALSPPSGAPYRFVFDDMAVADPRSKRQPEGSNGWSQVFDHDDFTWTDDGWTCFPLASALIYEMHVGTFTADGTFDSAIGKLDDLVDLGVTALEIMPVATFAGTRGWGYDGVTCFLRTRGAIPPRAR